MTRTALFAALIATAASAASAGGIITSIPNLTFPETNPPVTQGCSDVTTVGTCAVGQ